MRRIARWPRRVPLWAARRSAAVALAHEPAAALRPSSPSAYAAKLRSGLFLSLAELGRAPFAPPPAQVAEDGFRRIVEEHAALRTMLDAGPLPPPAELLLALPALARTDRTHIAALLHDAAGRLRAATAAHDEGGGARDAPREVAAAQGVVSAGVAEGGDAFDAALQTADLVAQLPGEHLAAWPKSPPGASVAELRAFHRLRLIAVAGAVRQGQLQVAAGTGDWGAAVVHLQHLGVAQGALQAATEAAAAIPEPTAAFASAVAAARRLQHRGMASGTELRAVVAACGAAKEFTTALRVVRRSVEAAAQRGMADLPPEAWETDAATDAARAVVEATLTPAVLEALAGCVGGAADLAAFRAFFADSTGVLAHVAVSAPLYTSIIAACARCPDEPQRLDIALHLYRALRDAAQEGSGSTLPLATYTALVAVAASVKEPTQAFAFFHEARTAAKGAPLPPAMYTELLRSYEAAGYAGDCQATLETLVEAGVQLTRPAFHVALRASDSLRAARDVVATMGGAPYHICPDVTTHALLLEAARKSHGDSFGATDVLLAAADTHAAALGVALAARPEHGALPPTDAAAEGTLAAHAAYPWAMERLLLAVAPPSDSAAVAAFAPDAPAPAASRPWHERRAWRLAASVTSPLRVVQRAADVAAASGSLALPRGAADVEVPSATTAQRPTRLPPRCVACVVSGDVLKAGVLDAMAPTARFVSSYVIPHSALAALRRWVEAPTPMPGHDDPGAAARHAVRQLHGFMAAFGPVVHVVTAAEEIAYARDMARFGLSLRRDEEHRAAFFGACLVDPAAQRRVSEALHNALPRDTAAAAAKTAALYHDAGAAVVIATYDVGLARYVRGHPLMKGRLGRRGERPGPHRVVVHPPDQWPAWLTGGPSAADLRSAPGVDLGPGAPPSEPQASESAPVASTPSTAATTATTEGVSKEVSDVDAAQLMEALLSDD